jgi:predicted NAD/FAD-binding protein
MLSLTGRPTWSTVTGGAARYVEALIAPFAHRVRTRAPVVAVTRHPTHVEVVAAGGPVEEFDEVVLAAHADDALAVLTDPTPAEVEVLGAFAYQPNEAVLHTDRSLLPRRRAAWAAWNYHLPPEPRGRCAVTYYMNHLQALPAERPYCVTLNRTAAIDPEQILRVVPYTHPVYTADSMVAQARHAEVSGVDRTHYCGAYWGWGFHEDGVVSAHRAVERMRERVPA